jgi:hypothetical protein
MCLSQDSGREARVRKALYKLELGCKCDAHVFVQKVLGLRWKIVVIRESCCRKSSVVLLETCEGLEKGPRRGNMTTLQRKPFF